MTCDNNNTGLVIPGVILGKDACIDECVKLGYKTGRKIADHTLRIGDDACIRFGTVIYGGTVIGNGLATGHNVIIREENEIGDNFNVWNSTTIDYGCKIGSNVKIHCNCYIAQFTVIEDNAFMAPGVTIANDIHPGCKFSVDCMRGPHIEEGVEIGVNVTILPFVRIGAHSVIGSGAVVNKDVPAGSVVVGNPGRVICSIYDLKCQSGLTDRPYGDILIHGSSVAQED
ncbi:MAG: acyltransferase [Armatimonadetes bacterium]|nr:acyltransferase [Armatimonadota bacterium]